MTDDQRAPSTKSQPPAPVCLYRAPGQRRFCMAPATHVIQSTSGATLQTTCAPHLEPSRAEEIRVPHRVVTVEEWAATGYGYRGPQLGGAATAAT